MNWEGVMKVIRILRCAALGLSFATAVPAFASGDSSADAASGFRDVKESTGVVLRVPINERGEELASAAEMRVHKGEASTSADLKTVFEAATIIPAVAVNRDSSTSADSSTHGWGWNNWYGNGWQSSNYYYSYTPSYNYYGSYYSYNQPYSYNYYSNYSDSNYYGYRYYYYNHCW
jgi:hypothetical protein